MEVWKEVIHQNCFNIPICFQDLVLAELMKKQRETELREIETFELIVQDGSVYSGKN